ncbi:hypothetical protein D9M68_45900 [compost metagenome]|jgi:hypothetical protein|uniref:hypothetical protein n=1 Tax=Cupriavidus necator TaxID=106590 RepID=UPI0028BABF46
MSNLAAIPPHGLLFVASDVDAADEADFNLWYDREHVEERARVPGFISAARYQAVHGGPKYLGLYRTESLAAFTSAAYKQAFRHQTPWSVTNLGRMRKPMRRVCSVDASVGQGSGSWLAVLPLPRADDAVSLIDRAGEVGDELSLRAGFVRSYLLVPDDELSQPLPNESLEGRQLLPLFVVESSDEQASELALNIAAQGLHADATGATRYILKWKLYAKELTS